MKSRFVLAILGMICITMWSLCDFEGSQAAEPAITMTQDLEIVSQMGGKATAVDVQSGYAYLAAGPRMQVYDVFEPSNPVLVSETVAYSSIIRELAVAGSYAYLGHDGNLLRVVDITDPFAPLDKGSMLLHSPYLDLGCLGDSFISQIEVQGSYVYVVVNVYCNFGTGSSLHILDVLDPTNPQEVSHYVVDDNVVDPSQFYISIVNDQVYVAYDRFLNVLDVNNPANPILLVEHDLGVNEFIQDITIVGAYAYIATENSFYIFDITTFPNPVMVGQYDHQSERIAVGGNQAYLLGDGFYILNTTDKTAPQLMGSNRVLHPQDVALIDGYAFVAADALYVFATTNLPGPPEAASFSVNSAAYDIYVANNRAYLVTQTGLYILDVSQVAQPILLGTTNVCGYVSELFVEGDIAYLGGGDSLCILDVSQPATPTFLHTHQFTPVQYPFDGMTGIAKRGNFLYLTLNEASCFPIGGCSNFITTLRILDVSNPAAPIEMPLYNNPSGGESSGLAVVGDYAYLAAGTSLRVLNLANPTVPIEVGSLVVPNNVDHIAVTGNRGYVNSRGSNPIINVINLQDPTNPTLIGEIESFPHIKDMTAVANTLYVIDDHNLHVIDASLPTAPIVIGEHVIDNFIYRFHLVGDKAFIAAALCYACNSGVMRVVNTTHLAPLSPIADAESVLQETKEVIAHDNYVYVQDGDKVQILLTQKRVMPIKVGEYSANGRVDQMVLVGDYLYLSLFAQNEIHIVDIASPTNPTWVSRTHFDFYGHGYMAVAGQYMYLTHFGGNGFIIWDVSAPGSPIEVGYYESDDAFATGFVTINDEYAYLFVEGNDDSYRLDIVNITNPTAPMLISNVPLTYSPVVDMVVANDIAYVLQYDSLLALDVTDPAVPQLLGTFGPWDSWPQNIEVRGQVAYVAEDLHGIQLLDISDPAQIQAMSLLELRDSLWVATMDDEIYVAAGEMGLITLRPFQESITSAATQFSSPSDDVTLQFGNNAPGTVQYQRWWQDEAVDNLAGVGLRFEIATVTTTEHLQQGSSPYTIIADYDLADLGSVREETLALYRRDGDQWLSETSSLLNMSEQTITASPEQMGQFAMLGETHRTYFATILNDHNEQGYRLRFNLDQDGNTFTDLSGYEHHGRCLAESCPTTVPGISKMARYFDGVNDFIQLDNPPTLNLQGEMMIAAWVKPETTTGMQNIVAHGYTGAPKGEVFLRIADGYYETGSWDGSNHLTSYPVPADDIGQWVYLAGVYDGTAWRLYRNGVEVSSLSDDTGSVSVHARWAIGATGAGTIRFFQGSIDEVAIYNRALSATEVEAEYHRHDG